MEISSTFISKGSEDDREDEYAHSRHHHHQWLGHAGKHWVFHEVMQCSVVKENFIQGVPKNVLINKIITKIECCGA